MHNIPIHTDTVHRCSNLSCKKQFSVLDKNAIFIEAWLNGQMSEYSYCSRKCFDEIMAIMKNPPFINENTVAIVREERVSEHPLKWRIVLKPVTKFKVFPS